MKGILLEIILINILIYVPGLNQLFSFTSVPSNLAITGLWMLPFMLLYDETRKYFIRKNQNGWLAKLTFWLKFIIILNLFIKNNLYYNYKFINKNIIFII